MAAAMDTGAAVDDRTLVITRDFAPRRAWCSRPGPTRHARRAGAGRGLRRHAREGGPAARRHVADLPAPRRGRQGAVAGRRLP